MKRLLRAILPPVATLALGLLLGFALGQRWGMQWTEPEVIGNLGVRLETASRLRLGEPEVALRLIDDAIDRALLFAAPQYDDLRPESRSSVQWAKVYRTIAPSAGANADEVHSFLAPVPMPERPASFCPQGRLRTEPTAFARLIKEQGIEW